MRRLVPDMHWNGRAVGEAQPAGSLALRPVIEHWNGHQWRLMANPVVPPQNALSAVTAAPGGQAWAVGTPFTNGRRGVVLHWTGAFLGQSYQTVTPA